MPQQLSLPGLGRNEPVCLFFVALMPDARAAGAAVRAAADCCRARGIHAKILPTNRLHVTLHRLAHYDESPAGLVRQMAAAAESITLPPFDVSFDRAKSFSPTAREHAFVLCEFSASAPLAEFHKKLGAALLKHGLGQHVRRDFTPHMTLFYDERELPEQPVPPIHWAVRDFVFVQSFQGFSRYHVLGRWPLRG